MVSLILGLWWHFLRTPVSNESANRFLVIDTLHDTQGARRYFQSDKRCTAVLLSLHEAGYL